MGAMVIRPASASVLLCAICASVATVGVAVVAAQGTRPPIEAGTIRITLLGTGAGPQVIPNRAGPATLIEAGSERLLFDAGRGATPQLVRSGVSPGTVTTLFLTHLHSDHIIDIADLFLSPWGAGQRRTAFEIIGPSGTSALANGLLAAFEFDLRIRRNAQNGPGAQIVSQELSDGSVWERNGVTVTAFLVDHGPVKPALGYRVDYGKRAVALSGDTTYSANLVEHARGVDLLIHEIAEVDAPLFQGQTPEQRSRTVGIHTTAEQAAQIFRQVKPKVAVYSHIAADPSVIVARTHKIYDGVVYAGDDLMTIDVGDRVEVKRAHR
jgi:ribonuclease Z